MAQTFATHLRCQYDDAMELTTDVLVVGAGGAGMYAAIAAAREGADVLIATAIGRGGATVMAQMTVAAALAEQEDRAEDHLLDTLNAGRGLANPKVAELLCAQAPDGCAKWIAGASAGRATASAFVRCLRRAAAQAVRLRRFPEHRPGGCRNAAQGSER